MRRGRAVTGHLSRVPICLPQLQAKTVLSCRPRLRSKGSAASGVLTELDHNVDDLLRIYEQPETFSDDEIRGIIIRNHVAAAKKLAGIGPIEDIFEAGVLEDDEE